MKLITQLQQAYQRLAAKTETLIEPLALLFMRLTVAKVFLDSGLVKWDGFLQFNSTTYDLFLYEFFCPEEPRPGALLLCDPTLLDYPEGSAVLPFIKALAVAAGIAEVVLPVLLIIGLMGRFAALGLLAITVFIQLAVFPSWSHWVNPASWWAATLLLLVARGPGRLSLDRALRLERH